MAVEDPKEKVRKRINKIRNQNTDMDVKERAERKEAAKRKVKEDEKHYVDFLDDCVATSVSAMRDIRQEQDECWKLYNEEPPDFYDLKDEWQSHVVVPKPFGAVQFASSIVRKAFEIQFLSITNKSNPDAERLWQKLMQNQLGRNYAKFPIRFTDAAMMGFAIGTSMELIPQWVPGRGLSYAIVEPWKIHRDPDALSRDPQSGMYWVHQEWLDFYALQYYEKQGRYTNIDMISPLASLASVTESEYLTQEEIARRKNQTWTRSKFRNAVLVSEFWGTLLDKRGELLMPDCTYTVAAGRVIQEPEESPYKGIRWPGTAFSPLPNLLRFDGRGLLKGVKTMWEFMCGLLCLHADNLNWNVNPPVEINIQGLVDQSDVDFVPGKAYYTRDTVSGQQVVRTVDRKSITSDILANLNFAAQNFDRGTLVHDVVQGLPGYRSEMTARESAQNLEQSLTVFGLIGKNLEDGALLAIEAGADTIRSNISYKELESIVGPELAAKFRGGGPLGVEIPPITEGNFEVSGISAMMRDWEIVNSIREVVLPLFESPLFQPYLRPYGLLRSLETRLNIRDEGVLIDEKRAKAIDEAQQLVQEAGILAAAAQISSGWQPPGVVPPEPGVAIDANGGAGQPVPTAGGTPPAIG